MKERSLSISSGPHVDLKKNSFRPTCLIPDVFSVKKGREKRRWNCIKGSARRRFL